MDYKGFVLTPVDETEFDALFDMVKRALFEHVDAVFGWDDQLQRERLINEYQPQWFRWIESGEDRIGLLCDKPYEDAIHVHFLLLLPRYQNQGWGKLVMQHLHHQATQSGKKEVTLSSFVRNQGAIAFYRSLGYRLIEQDEQFMSMSFALTKSKSTSPTTQVGS